MRTLLVWVSMLIAGVACAQPMAWVPNEKSGTLSVVDTATDKVVGEVRTGGKPRGIAAQPDGTTVYVSDQDANALQVIDAAKREVRSRIALGPSPEGISVSRDGQWIAAAPPRCWQPAGAARHRPRRPAMRPPRSRTASAHPARTPRAPGSCLRS